MISIRTTVRRSSPSIPSDAPARRDSTAPPFHPFFTTQKWRVQAIIELSSPSNQPHTQNDPQKPLRPHCILTLEADRLAAHSHVGFVRAKFQSVSPSLEPNMRRKQKNTKRTGRPPELRHPSPITERTESHYRTSLNFASPEPSERRKPLPCKTLHRVEHLRILRHRLFAVLCTPSVRILRYPQPGTVYHWNIAARKRKNTKRTRRPTPPKPCNRANRIP